jgi:hypothetical protein
LDTISELVARLKCEPALPVTDGELKAINRRAGCCLQLPLIATLNQDGALLLLSFFVRHGQIRTLSRILPFVEELPDGSLLEPPPNRLAAAQQIFRESISADAA